MEQASIITEIINHLKDWELKQANDLVNEKVPEALSKRIKVLHNTYGHKITNSHTGKEIGMANEEIKNICYYLGLERAKLLVAN